MALGVGGGQRYPKCLVVVVPNYVWKHSLHADALRPLELHRAGSTSLFEFSKLCLRDGSGQFRPERRLKYMQSFREEKSLLGKVQLPRSEEKLSE
jgi:hypothetical protein